ncbi:MAG TPA: hypothetical protein VIQ81_11985 [Gammaproteobacteria bacterium]
MSEELYEVAFYGEIVEGAELDQVKAKVASMFKADAAKLAQLFSGKRVVIKKNIDQATANKYKSALQNAGAQCEVKSLAEAAVAPPAESAAAPAAAPAATPAPAPAQTAAPAASSSRANSNAPAAPKTDPLGISANEISDLGASILPPGSNMQDGENTATAPEVDLSGLDLAPPGSDMGELKKDETVEIPDISNLSIVDSK